MVSIPLKIENIEPAEAIDRDRFAEDVNKEIQAIAPGSSIIFAKRPLGGFASVGPSILDFILRIGEGGTLAVILKATIQLFIARQRPQTRPYRVTVGSASVDLPPNARVEDVEKIVKILAKDVTR
jgi:hypothetical protein